MRFRVYRTSDHFNRNAPQPCDGAIDGGIVQVNTFMGKQRVWYLDIGSLNDLLSVDNEIVVSPGSEGELPTLEIVDDYRE